MKTMQDTELQTIAIAAITAAMLAVCGPKSEVFSHDDVLPHETKNQTLTTENAPTGAGDARGEQDSTINTHEASCRCGQLAVTYKGPAPERITLCHCNSCQLRTGTMFSVQGRFPRSRVKIEGKSTKWTFPSESGQPVNYRSCDSGGATYHFCPVCGTTVYWDIAAAPDVIGIAIGTLTDPTFPPPKISGFESYGHPWAMKAADLPMRRLELAE